MSSDTRGEPSAAERATVLTTPRLQVTTWLPDDLDELRALHTDPQVMRYMTSGLETLDQTRARLDAFLREQETPGWTKWRVEDSHGAFVGRAGFRQPHRTGHRELGYLLAPGVWGLGYATELATALVDWHHTHPEPGVDASLRAYAAIDNQASRKVLDRAGFQLTGSDPADEQQLIYEANP
ncbi:GNAT family N-acetyltransferase [Streptomyces iconiensis]|uniref:GNAT family N-acetyltransferase n=1 Tax=Streptomyces iconiensis TaxID=1384038 RepID=A0ABT7A190_9ACTN|nr:GNAT family N-acetyltransferase [Streptomyces iconiensis]MDJ1135081.1 GNAT family N-acetyltransferase [Streptomyces iconiensis]